MTPCFVLASRVKHADNGLFTPWATLLSGRKRLAARLSLAEPPGCPLNRLLARATVAS